MEEVHLSDALQKYKIGKINALAISQKNKLGSMVNTTVLGAYVRLTQIIPLHRVTKVIREIVPAAADQNVMAAKEGYETVALVGGKGV